ncbi:hypothetical protein BTHE_1939 [Bifidobacterium thermophilum]|nr:hypothetical protein BTHE_1939 [Bifidobacterium thermophilum]
MLKIVHDYIHCQHGNRLRPCAELGGRLPTPVTSPACPLFVSMFLFLFVVSVYRNYR